MEYTVFAEINAHHENKRPPKTVISKGGVHKINGLLMGDFSKGGVHKTDSFRWVIFQRGEYTKPMAFGIIFYCF